MPLGHIVAQVTHAAGESSPGNLPPNTYAVVLAAANESILLRLNYELSEAGIPHVIIREPDAPYSGEATAIGVVPCDRDLVRRHLARLPLLKEKV